MLSSLKAALEDLKGGNFFEAKLLIETDQDLTRHPIIARKIATLSKTLHME